MLKSNGYSTEKVKRYYYKMGGKHELPLFNEIIIDELMQIKESLASVKASQIKMRGKELAFWKLPEDFIAKWLFYIDYPYSAICTDYETTEGEGFLIIVLDDFPYEYDNDSFSIESVRRIKAFKTTTLKKGMNLRVHLWEPGMKSCAEYDRDSVIDSIEEDSYGDYIIFNLEISLVSESDCVDFCFDLDKKIEESKIKRKIKIYSVDRRWWLKLDSD
jgi:hypothetical protein